MRRPARCRRRCCPVRVLRRGGGVSLTTAGSSQHAGLMGQNSQRHSAPRPSLLSLGREEALLGAETSKVTSAAGGRGRLGGGRKQTLRQDRPGGLSWLPASPPPPPSGRSGCREQGQGPAAPCVLRAAPPTSLAVGPEGLGVGVGCQQGRRCLVAGGGLALAPPSFVLFGAGKGAPQVESALGRESPGGQLASGAPCPGCPATGWRALRAALSRQPLQPFEETFPRPRPATLLGDHSLAAG